MRFLIHTDAASKVAKDCSEDDARGLQAQGFTVERLDDEGNASPFEPAAPEVAAEETAPAAEQAQAKKAAPVKAAAKAVPAKTAKKR